MQRIPPLSPFCQAAAAEESISHTKCLPAYGKNIPFETFLHIFNFNFYTNLDKIAISLVCFIKTVQNTVTPLVHPHAEGARAVELIRVARSQAHPVRFSQIIIIFDQVDSKEAFLLNLFPRLDLRSVRLRCHELPVSCSDRVLGDRRLGEGDVLDESL